MRSILTFQQIERKNKLIQFYKSGGHLSAIEAQELKELIERDNTLEEGIKLLVIFALVAMKIYATRYDRRS